MVLKLPTKLETSSGNTSFVTWVWWTNGWSAAANMTHCNLIYHIQTYQTADDWQKIVQGIEIQYPIHDTFFFWKRPPHHLNFVDHKFQQKPMMEGPSRSLMRHNLRDAKQRVREEHHMIQIIQSRHNKEHKCTPHEQFKDDIWSLICSITK